MDETGMGSEDEAVRLYREGRAALRGGQAQLGMASLRRAAELAPHFKTYESLGEALLEAGRPVDAVLFLSAAVGLGNRQSKARFLLATALLALGPEWVTDAARKLREALLINPQYKSAALLLDELFRANTNLATNLADEDAPAEQ